MLYHLTCHREDSSMRKEDRGSLERLTAKDSDGGLYWVRTDDGQIIWLAHIRKAASTLRPLP